MKNNTDADEMVRKIDQLLDENYKQVRLAINIAQKEAAQQEAAEKASN